jgi:uncharacterized membrane protein (UPF0127 family)
MYHIALFYKNNVLVTKLKLITPLTDEDKAKGLMFCKHLPIDTGMLFTGIKNDSFWMKNTYIPLDLIFIYENVIVDIKHGDRLSLSPIYSDKIYNKVIEVNNGWCNYFNIDINDIVIFL